MTKFIELGNYTILSDKIVGYRRIPNAMGVSQFAVILVSGLELTTLMSENDLRALLLPVQAPAPSSDPYPYSDPDKKGCHNCRHEEKDAQEKPCRNCEGLGDWPSGWERR